MDSMCCLIQRVEHHHFVDPVQELGTEVLLHLHPHRILDVLGGLPGHLHDVV